MLTRTNQNGPAEQGQGFVFKKLVFALFCFLVVKEVSDGLVVDLCCLCFWVSCGLWSLTWENDVARMMCKKRWSCKSRREG